MGYLCLTANQYKKVQSDLMEILVLRQFLVAPALRKVRVLQGYLEGHVYAMDMWKDASLQDHTHCHNER